MSQNTQISKQEVTKQRVLQTTISLASLVAGLTSAIVIYALFAKMVFPISSGTLAFVIVLVLTLVAVGTLELVPRSFLPSALDKVFANKLKGDRTMKAEVLFSIVISLLLVTGSMLTSYLSREKISEYAVGSSANTVDMGAFLVKQDSINRVREIEKNEKLDKIVTLNSELDKKAAEEAKKLLEDAKNSKGKRMRELLNNGNEWAQNQVREEMNAAKAAADKNKENNKILIQNLSKDGTGGISEAERIAMIQQANKAEQERYDEEKSKYEGYAVYLGLGASLVALLIQILASLHRIANKITIEKRRVAPDIIYSFIALLDNIMDKLSNGIYKGAIEEDVVEINNGRVVTIYNTNTLPPIQQEKSGNDSEKMQLYAVANERLPQAPSLTNSLPFDMENISQDTIEKPSQNKPKRENNSRGNATQNPTQNPRSNAGAKARGNAGGNAGGRKKGKSTKSVDKSEEKIPANTSKRAKVRKVCREQYSLGKIPAVNYVRENSLVNKKMMRATLVEDILRYEELPYKKSGNTIEFYKGQAQEMIDKYYKS